MSTETTTQSASSLGETKVDVGASLQNQTSAGGHGFDQFLAQAAESRARIDAADSNDAADSTLATHSEQTKKFRANAVLDKQDWQTIDDRILEVAQENLRILDDLRRRGLTVTEDLSTLVYKYGKAIADEVDDAALSMGLEARGQDVLVGGAEETGVPLPICHRSYHMNRRTLLSGGSGVNTRLVEAATEGVTNRLERMVFEGWDGAVDGYSIPGLLTEPNRNVFGGVDWTDQTNVSNDAVYDDILTAIENLEDDDYGPGSSGYVLYLGRSQEQILRRRRLGNENTRSLLFELREQFGDDIEFQRASHLPDGQAVMIKPVRQVVEVVLASDVQDVEWSSHGDMTTHHKVMACMVPLVKSDTSGGSGVVHFTTDGSASPSA